MFPLQLNKAFTLEDDFDDVLCVALNIEPCWLVIGEILGMRRY